jgi:hypothetical protein
LVVADYVYDVQGIARGPFDYVPKLVAISMIALVTLVNYMGNKLSNIVTKSLLECKLFCVASIIILGFTVLIGPRFSPSVVLAELKSPPRPGLRNYTDATLLAMWAYSGWEAVCVASIYACAQHVTGAVADRASQCINRSYGLRVRSLILDPRTVRLLGANKEFVAPL